MSRSQKLTKIIDQDEELTLRLLLASQQESNLKLALFRICECYQNGKRFRRPSEIQLIIRGLVHYRAPEVERWAIKALLEFRDPTDFDLIESRLRSPPQDYENFTWAVSAFFAIANDNQINEAIEKGRIPKDGMSMLACNYAGRESFARGRFPSINIQNADALTLKWSALTMAIGRAKGGIFDPTFKQTDQLVALTGHDDRDVVQYSVYAIYRLPRLTFENTKIPIESVLDRPTNVRRWIYRLICKDGHSYTTNRDFLIEAIRAERDVDAREGLALGLRDVWFDGLADIMCDWLSRESNPKCRTAIIEHMAGWADHSIEYRALVLDTFRESRSDRVLRSRILDTSVGTTLYAELNRAKVIEEAQTDLFGQSVSGGLIVMGNNNQIFKDANHIQIGANSIGGNATASNIEQTISLDNGLREVLKEIRNLIENHTTDDNSTLVLKTVEEIEKKPEIGRIRQLLEQLKIWSGAGAVGAEVVSNIQPIIEALQKILGS